MKNRMLISLALVISIAYGTAMAQEDGLPPPVRVVANLLSLSEEQVGSWLETMLARDQAVRPLAEQAREIERVLSQEIEKPAPDPLVVGGLVIELRTLQKQIETHLQTAKAQFVQLLDAEQQQKLQRMTEAAQICPAVEAFRATGLM